MNNDPLQKHIPEKVIERISREKIPMRSRAHFIIRIALTGTVSMLALILSAYVLSFIAFSIHESGEQFLLGFGMRGVRIFLVLFPWGALIADTLLIVLLEWLLQRFAFGYRIPLLKLFGLLAALAAFGAFLIGLTPIHSTILDTADQGSVPVIGEWYERIRTSREENGIFRGTISSIQEDRITITHDDTDHDADDGTHTIILPAGYPADALRIGERVYVLGTQTGTTTVQALGIDRLSPDQ